MTAIGEKLMLSVKRTMCDLARTSRAIANDGERLWISELLRDTADAIDFGAGERMKSPPRKSVAAIVATRREAKRAPLRELVLLTPNGLSVGRPLYVAVRRAVAK